MKNFTALFLSFFVVLLAGCSSEKPLTEAEQAAEYGMTVTEYREEKEAAARMGMSWEEHIKMKQGSEMMEGM